MNDYVIAKYIRLSIDDNITESLSIENQRALLDCHIDALDISNAEVLEFVDNGYTGMNLDRPAVRELLDLVERGRVNCIVTKDFSRFSRSAIESGYYIEQVFPLYRIRFIAVSEPFDSADYKNSTGGMEVAFKFLMHEHYSQDISKKVKSMKRVQMANGENIVANAIYGYRKSKSGQWEPDPIPAEVVRRIFRMALDGLPTAVIRDRLCAEKIPTPREYMDVTRHGKDIAVMCVWTARMVLSVLNNEQYTGTYISGKQRSKAIGSHSKIYTDKSEWIIMPDRHPAIISKEDFAAMREIRERFKGSTTVKPMVNPMQDENRPRRGRMISGERIAAFPIYGYIKAAGGRWEIDETAAAVIREIYDMARQGLTCAEIRDKLIEAEYPTPSEYIRRTRGHTVSPLCRWTDNRVREILKNIQYTGAYVSGKILKDYETGKSYHTAQSDWIVIPGKHPAIVSEDLFGEVKAIMASGRVKRKNMRPQEYLLRGGILKCGCCGYALVYDESARGGVYRCQHTLAVPEAACHKMKVNAADLDEAVLNIIRKQAEVVIGMADLSSFRKVSMDARQSADCEKQLRSYMEQRQQCYEQFVGGEIDKDTFQSVKSGYTAQIERLNHQLALLRQGERDREENKKAAMVAKEVLGEAVTHREIVETLIDKLYVSPGDRVEIHWKVENFAESA